jgi:pimeloyl-ACP methyl ester carboxylesterase
MRRSIVTSLMVAGIVLATSIYAYAQAEATVAPETGYASVNGLEMYYEIYGAGEPIILLHGGLGGIVEFSQIIPFLAETRQVIAVELQGHGHTADIDRPLSFETMADDIAALVGELGYEKVDLLGFSLGGGVALRTAIQHPEIVRNLILISTPFKRSGIHAEFQAGMSPEYMNAESASQMLNTPMYQYYSSVAPRLDDWAEFVGKVGEFTGQDYDWTEEVEAMTTPTLIVQADNDMLPPSQGVEEFNLRGGGVAGGFAQVPNVQLAVLPNTIHFNILYRSDLLAPIINGFLNPPPAPAQ